MPTPTNQAVLNMHLSDAPPPAIFLLGPTASGKTASALALAKSLPIEIISVDSALVYRDMDVGTAKPDAEELATCPHHLIDIISPEQSYSAARFREDALELMNDISARGRVPLLVGGTMLYYKALREGLSELPKADAALRAQIDHEAERLGWPALHAQLAQLDPDAAARLETTDAQRIQRALEIVQLSGRPLADNYARRKGAPLRHRLLPIAITPSSRQQLHERIAQRFDLMLNKGLVEELQQLQGRYQLEASLPSMRCVGYRQAWDYLAGRLTYTQMRDKGIVATRQLAKRQLTWQRQFRENWQDVVETDCLAPDLPDRVLDIVKRQLGA